MAARESLPVESIERSVLYCDVRRVADHDIILTTLQDGAQRTEILGSVRKVSCDLVSGMRRAEIEFRLLETMKQRVSNRQVVLKCRRAFYSRETACTQRGDSQTETCDCYCK